MRKFIAFLLLFFMLGCGSKEFNKQTIADAVINYYTPYSSVDIFVPQDVNVIEYKKMDEKNGIAKVCYSFLFLKNYSDLVGYIKKHPNSSLAQYDIGLVALLGRKFGNFKKNETKRRCDRVKLHLALKRWVVKEI